MEVERRGLEPRTSSVRGRRSPIVGPLSATENDKSCSVNNMLLQSCSQRCIQVTTTPCLTFARLATWQRPSMVAKPTAPYTERLVMSLLPFHVRRWRCAKDTIGA